MGIIDVNKRIQLIDLYDLKQPHRTGSFVLLDDHVTLIETSASPSIPYLKQGLTSLGISLDKVQYIILTHIHLDHGGGAGLLLQDCPNAKVVVHPKGARHLIDPSKLELGAREVYQDQFDELFQPILPVPKERIIIKGDEETLKIGADTYLTFYDSPGHAKHHFSIYDPVSNGMFTGDTAGIYYYTLKNLGIEFFLPSTSPNQFNPEDMIKSLRFYKEQSLSYLYFGHFGYTNNVNKALKDVKEWIGVFMECSKDAYLTGSNDSTRFELTYTKLRKLVFQKLVDLQVPSQHPVFDTVDLDLKVSTMGLIDYWKKQENVTFNPK